MLLINSTINAGRKPAPVGSSLKVMEPRPQAVTIIAAVLAAATATAVVVGCALLFPGKLLDWLAQFNRPGMEIW